MGASGSCSHSCPLLSTQRFKPDSLRERSRPIRGSRSVLVLALALLPTLSLCAPLVFEETARIAAPDASFDLFPHRLAVEGDTIIATGVEYVGDIEHHHAFLFKRQSTGTWAYVRTLASTSCNSGEVGEDTCLASVAIRNGLAVIAAGKVHVFVRQSDGNWVAAPSDNFSGPGEAAVGTGVVLTSQIEACNFNAEAMRKNAAGTWTQVMTFPGFDMPGCDDWGMIGEDVDISAGNRVIAADTMGSGTVNIFEPSGPTWTHTATLASPVGAYFGSAVAIDDDKALVSGISEAPIHVFDRESAWSHGLDIGGPDSIQTGSPGVLKVRDLVVAGYAGDPHRGGSVALYRRISTDRYQQVARLVSRDSVRQFQYLGWGDVDIHVTGSTARVVAGGVSGMHVFDLKTWGTTPAPLQENFEQGAGRWAPLAGSAFTVVTSGESKVYRQSSLTGAAGSFITSIDWKNQAIEADCKPTAIEGTGTDRWVGLVIRRTDENNYYYVTLRSTNRLEIKRMRNGAFVTLATAAVPFVRNRTYRLRLEAVGTLVRAYVDGRMALQVHDTALTHGHAGLRMYKARADFDNVIVSQNPHLTLIEQRSPYVIEHQWKFETGSWVADYSSGNPKFVQSSTGGARAVSRVAADDQIVQVRATLDGFASGDGTRWFGVMARFADANNYYYVTVRRENTIALRKLVNGTIQVLDTAPFTVTNGGSYNLRLEAVGSSLRAYVNGTLLLQASDASHARGRYGMVMYGTATTYQDFTAWEP